MQAAQRSFDVDMERKLWSLDTKTSALLPRTTPLLPPPPPPPSVDSASGSVLSHAHQHVSAFLGTRPLPRGSVSSRVSVDSAAPSELRAIDAVSLPLNVLLYLYVFIACAAVAFVPASRDPRAPFYAGSFLVPLLSAALALHIVLCYSTRRRLAATVGAAAVGLTLPLALATLRDVHGSLFEGRFLAQLALLHIQVFFGLALPRRHVAVLALTGFVFAVPVSLSESVYPGERMGIHAVFAVEGAWALLLALAGARTFTGTSAVVRIA